MTDKSKSGTQPLSTGLKMLQVIEAVAAMPDGATAADVARELGWARGATHQYLSTAVAADWVFRDDAGTYRVALRIAAIGRAAMAEAGVTDVVLPTMNDLVERLHEPASFAVIQDGHPTIIERVEPNRGIQVRPNAESRMSIRTSASGQILVAYLEPAVRERWRKREPQLHDEDFYATIREQGYTTIEGHWLGDTVAAAAVPVLREGTCLGALSVIGPAHRVDMPAMLSALVEARDEVNTALSKERNG